MKKIGILLLSTLTISSAYAYEINYSYDELVSEINSLKNSNQNVKVKNTSEFLKMKEYVAKKNRLIDERYITNSFYDLNGSKISCIDIYHQPSLKLKRNHHLQLKPIDLGITRNYTNFNEYFDSLLFNIQSKKTRVVLSPTQRCRVGTVPIVRETIELLSQYETFDEFEKNSLNAIFRSNSNRNLNHSNRANNPDGYQHEYAVVGKRPYGGSKGIAANISLHNPYVENGSASMSQIWAVGGKEPHRQTLEAGIIKSYNSKISNSKTYPVLFVYTTSNSFADHEKIDPQTGQFIECYNTCNFHQVSSNYVPGGTIIGSSEINGPQYDARFEIRRGPNYWWLSVNSELVGYWDNPRFNANGILYKANDISWGGEVSSKVKGRSTYTDMGSGRHATEGWKKSAFMRNMQWIDQNDNIINLTNPVPTVTKPNCYSLTFSKNGSWGSHIYFGGPGKNQRCY